MATFASQPWLQLLASQAGNQDRILVVIQLSGGNDGLNTIVPYRDEAYYRARPKLAIAADSVLKINDSLGLSPALKSLEQQLSDQRFTIIQGVGYPQPNRSHFESMDIWHTCQRKTNRAGYGWLGRCLSEWQAASTSSAESLALHLGQEQQPLALVSRDATVPSIASLEQFRLKLGDRAALEQAVRELVDQAAQGTTPAPAQAIEMTTADQPSGSDLLEFIQASSQTALAASQRLEEAARRASGDSQFPKSALGEKLQVIAQLIASDLPTRIYYVTLDGFDTHAQQPAAHTGLLRQWSEALSAFHDRLAQAGHGERVLVMTFSEFGRRVAENASDGTDHGAAAPLFLSGPKLKQTIHGQQPSLTDLDDGDLKFHTDFRSVYATIIEKWFTGNLNSQEILGEQFAPLDLI